MYSFHKLRFIRRQSFLAKTIFITASILFVLSSIDYIKPFSSISDVKRSYFQCRPSEKIAFFRTHRCGSSTIQNILFRYATKLNLNVAIPAWNYFTIDPNIQKNNPLNVKQIKSIGDNYVPTDILANHMLHRNYTRATNVIGPGLKTFTILRDPVTQFESLYSYMDLEKMYGMSFKELITILIRNNSTAIKELNNKPRQEGLFGHNQIAWDLGISPTSFSDPITINKTINQLENEFDLMLMANRMEESLVLLRQLLCLPSLEDVSYLVASSRKPELVVRLNREEKDVPRNWLGADDQIYRHFSNLFDAKVEEFGRSRMDEEKLKLRVINKNLWERCVIKQVGNEMLNGKYQGSSDKTFGYIVKEEEPGCDLFATNENEFITRFQKQ